jgi:hypothetical protein
MNKFKNEMEITLGPEKILLRPTFENLAEMETNVGSVGYLSWKFSQGVRKNSDGSLDSSSLNSRETIQSLPSLSEITQIIYYNQAERKFEKQDIYEMIVSEGAYRDCMIAVTIFIGKMLTGGQKFDEEELLEKKKSSQVKKKS